MLVGSYWRAVERYAEAEPFFGRAAALAEQVGCGEECTAATPLGALADVLRLQPGREKEAAAVQAELARRLDDESRARRRNRQP